MPYSGGGQGGIPGVIDHGLLVGLADDDHNQYHIDSRALTWLGSRSTSDLPEGSNEYYTDAKVSANGSVVANTAKVSAAGSVTSHSDISSAGSGIIITALERSKLIGIEALADVTDPANVAAAGGLISSNNLSDVGNEVTSRANLGLIIGTDVQVFSPDLDTIAGLDNSTGAFIVGDTGVWTSKFGNDASTLLGLGISDRARFAHILLNGSVPIVPKGLIEATGSLVKETANCTSSGAGNRDIACIGHGFIVGDAVGLPSGAASAQEVFTVAAVADSDNYTVDSDLTNAIVAVPGQQDPSMMIFNTGDLKKRFEIDKSGVVNLIGPGLSGRGGKINFQGDAVFGATIESEIGINGNLKITAPINNCLIEGGSEVKLTNTTAVAGGITIDGTLGVVIKTTGVPTGGDIDLQPKDGNIDCASTTGALIVTRMTTTERDALTAINGMMIYNTTANAFQKRENGAWVTT